MKRTFVAIKIHPEEEFKELLREIQNELEVEKIKWTDPGNMHITLRFLGDTEDIHVDMISRILDEVADEFHPFSFSVEGAGVFKSYRSPRVIWFGLKNTDTMKKIKNSIDFRLTELGFPADEKDYRPHLTIGRVKYVSDRNKMRSLLEGYESHEFLREMVNEIVFFESTLTPKGPVYEVISSHTLGMGKT